LVRCKPQYSIRDVLDLLLGECGRPMRRREFISLIGGAAVARPFAACAQEAGLKRVGVLQPQPESDADFQGWRTIFSSRLRELGWTDGRNIHIDYRFGTGEVASVAPLAKEMVAQQPDALFAITALSALALRQYTLTIPTVFVQVGDPVALGLVTNLARPSGNVTGFSSSDYTIGGKWIETIKDAVPKLRWAAVFFEAGNPSSTQYMVEIEAAAARGNLRLIPVPIGTSGDIETGFANFPGRGCARFRRFLVITPWFVGCANIPAAGS
jgi:putative tryptophan/tyrosine transport system substrate-binding protein